MALKLQKKVLASRGRSLPRPRPGAGGVATANDGVLKLPYQDYTDVCISGPGGSGCRASGNVIRPDAVGRVSQPGMVRKQVKR